MGRNRKNNKDREDGESERERPWVKRSDRILLKQAFTPGHYPFVTVGWSVRGGGGGVEGG